MTASSCGSTCWRVVSSSYQATISRAPCSNGIVATKSGHDRAHLGVVEDHRVRLVAEQAGAPLRVGGRDRVRGHVHDVRPRRRPPRRGSRAIWFQVERLVGGDVEGVADRARMPEQRHEPAREVLVVGQRPQRRAVAVHDDRLAPRASGRSRSSRRRTARACGRRCATAARSSPGSPRRGRRAISSVLAGDLVAGVLPERVAQRRRLDHRQARRRRLVGRGRADEHVLTGAPAEQLEVGPRRARA